jgi:shikimate kinase
VPPLDIEDRHLALIGAMGAGKTTVGTLVADELDRPFLDNDIALRSETGSSAAELAATVGTVGLHEHEVRVLVQLLTRWPPAVIAAAASTVGNDEARQCLHRCAAVVWLRGTPDVLAARAQTASHRPFVSDPTLLVRLADERAAHYEAAADLIVDVETTAPTDAATTILGMVRDGG